MREVYLSGQARLPVRKRETRSLRTLGALVLEAALGDAGNSDFDALYVSNLIGDELQHQKHLAPLIATEAGFIAKEALDVRAATAAGAAALRTAFLSVAAGAADTAVALGVEVMSQGDATAALATVLDAEFETARGETMLTVNARLMRQYMDRYGVSHDVFVNFSHNAHINAASNPDAVFQRAFSRERIARSPAVIEPLSLMDCAPICDGAAAVVLSSAPPARGPAVRILASTVACDAMRVDQREDPLALAAARWSAERAFAQAKLGPDDVDFFENHDAFTIMSCLALEACGFAERGQGWRFADEGRIFLNGGSLPLSTFGGLKARGHPVGATALYQAGEILQQMRGEAGPNQVARRRTAMMQSIGGAGTTIITHIFAQDG